MSIPTGFNTFDLFSNFPKVPTEKNLAILKEKFLKEVIFLDCCYKTCKKRGVSEEEMNAFNYAATYLFGMAEGKRLDFTNLNSLKEELLRFFQEENTTKKSIVNLMEELKKVRSELGMETIEFAKYGEKLSPILGAINDEVIIDKDTLSEIKEIFKKAIVSIEYPFSCIGIFF